MKKYGKKLAFGAASLALIGGMAPMLTNNSYAYTYNYSDMLYTTVGPDYFTILDIEGITDQEGVTVRSADTSIVDRYYGDDINDAMIFGKKLAAEKERKVPIGAPSFVCSMEGYICLQGKKIGETELTIYSNGDTYRYPITSVKLTPEANNVGALGDSFTGTATIEGADEDLLSLVDYDSRGNVNVSIRGNRGTSYTVRSYKDSDSSRNRAYLYWRIGDQYVSGGTNFTFYPVEIENNVDGLDETNTILKEATLDLILSFEGNGTLKPIPVDALSSAKGVSSDGAIVINDFETRDGSIADINFNTYDINGPLANYKTIYDLDENDLSSALKTKLTDKLPNTISNIAYKNVSIKTNYGFYDYSGSDGPIKAVAKRELVELVDDSDYDDYDVAYIAYAEFKKLGTPLNITLDVSDAPELKSGYTRKYYVAMENGNKVELVDGEYNEKAKTFTFATQYFGNFAYGFVDELVPKVPDTGSPLEKVAKTAAVSFLPLIALTGVAFGIRNRKKASHKLAKKIDR